MRRPGSVDLILVATVLIWAFNVTVTRYVLTHGFQPLAYGAIRYGVAALLAVSVALLLEHSLSVGGRRSLLLIALAAGFLLINQISFVYALKLSSATTVALGAGGDLSSGLGGVLLAIALSASWGCYSVLIAPLMRRYSPYRISAVVLCVMCVPFLTISSRQLESQDYASLTPLIWVCLAYAIVGPLFLTNLLWFTAVHRVGPSRATLFANVQPFVSAVLAFVILSEHLHWLEVLGGFAILAGIVLERYWRPAPAPLPAE